MSDSKEYLVPYKRIEWGESLVLAKSLEEARKGEFEVYEDYDNKSEYEFETKMARRARRSPRGGWE